jgi:hypothetical protein
VLRPLPGGATGQFVAPADMGGAILAPAIVDVRDGPRPARALDPASQTLGLEEGIRGPLTLSPNSGQYPRYVLHPSASVAAQVSFRDGGTSAVGDSRDAPPACPSGRPFERMTGTLPPHRSQGFGGRSTMNSGTWAACLPLALHPPARGLPDKAIPSHPPPRLFDTSQYPAHHLRMHGSSEPLEGRRPGPPRARLTDCTGALAPLGDEGPCLPWHHVWGAVAHSGLSFVERACPWWVLHGSVFTETFKTYVSMPVSPADRFCPRSTCGAPHRDTSRSCF